MTAFRSLFRQAWRPPCVSWRAYSSPVVHKIPSHTLRRRPVSRPPSSRFFSASVLVRAAPHRFTRPYRSARRGVLALVVVSALGVVSYLYVDPFRHFVIAVHRCVVVGWAVSLSIIDYKILFARNWPDTPEGKKHRHHDYEACHTRCAVRIRNALLRNGGIYIKLGQHLAGVNLVPDAWSTAMRPLQDQCNPTPLEEVAELFLKDTGRSLDDHFTEFNPEPIGVASLAQVHIATDRKTGQRVAVKLMHPNLEDFAHVDMKTTTFMLKLVKSVFPTFEFSWLGEEMEQNLPLEMDFRHEARNAIRCRDDFAHLKSTSLVIPHILWARKRVMVMEFIDGARVDDLAYLLKHSIDRNSVALELSRIFSQMLYINGFFHADPHHGNLLIRPAKPGSRSPHNFEIVLLDHGLYFSIDEELRTNYARLWLSLLSPSSPEIVAKRRHYAKIVGNIDEEHYAVFESALTGRASLDSSARRASSSSASSHGSIMDLEYLSPEESRMMRNTVLRDGLIEQIFAVLRCLPRKLLMVIKLNDLTRSLDVSLHPTHPPHRIWLIVSEYCVQTCWNDDRKSIMSRLVKQGLSFSLMGEYISKYWTYRSWMTGIWLAEVWADGIALTTSWRLWYVGLVRGGWKEARARWAGLLEEDSNLNGDSLPT